MKQHVVIIGAGISGLALAYRLSRLNSDLDITVLEKGARSGGAVATLREEGYQVEMGPNGFLDTKPSTLDLCKDLGLSAHLVAASEGARKNRYLFLGDGLKRLPDSPSAFLRSDLLSWRGKLGFFAERWRRSEIPDDESIDAFARRRAGNEAAEVFADALVTGIYAGDPTLLSLPACFPRLAAFESAHGSVLKGFALAAKQRRKLAEEKGEKVARPGTMWSLTGGLGTLVETLAAALTPPPRLNIPPLTLGRQNAAWRIESEDGERWNADAVVLCTPAYGQSTLLKAVDAPLAQEVGGIAYNRVAVVALGYRQSDVPMSLNGFGFIAPQRLRRDLLGVQWCSSIFKQRAPAGMVLMRALVGGWQRPEMIDWEDGRLLEAVSKELRQAMGIVVKPAFQRIIRWDRAIPQYHVGHRARLARIEALLLRHPGLFVGGNAYHGVALNDCTEQALILAPRIDQYLRAKVV